mmetsp:Transcript_10484/g.38012  ORF Transcript_10484/g.38012 Transcript_10484/m.38012 type:complete len:312 (+) Transcript_10484:61-996(+)|eukprot:29149-Pelagococcus_subviridis.AAC.8
MPPSRRRHDTTRRDARALIRPRERAVLHVLGHAHRLEPTGVLPLFQPALDLVVHPRPARVRAHRAPPPLALRPISKHAVSPPEVSRQAVIHEDVRGKQRRVRGGRLRAGDERPFVRVDFHHSLDDVELLRDGGDALRALLDRHRAAVHDALDRDDVLVVHARRQRADRASLRGLSGKKRGPDVGVRVAEVSRDDLGLRQREAVGENEQRHLPLRVQREVLLGLEPADRPGVADLDRVFEPLPVHDQSASRAVVRHRDVVEDRLVRGGGDDGHRAASLARVGGGRAAEEYVSRGGGGRREGGHADLRRALRD